jgi:prepilin-type processing-associated H-X9-DG protein
MNMNLSPWDLPDPTMMSQIKNLPFVVFMAEAPGQYSSTYPSSRAYSVAAPHGGKGNLLFLDGHVQTLSASYLGCGVGDPKHPDVFWLTGTASDAQAATY